MLVQRGYRRPVRGPTYPDGHAIRLVDTAYARQGVRWYPGVAMQGEGIFIDLPDDNPTLSKRAELWVDREKDETAISESTMLNPLFVWWHTLAHRIIYGLSIDSGYSSAAIRERIYFRKKSAGKSSGGILLYTSQQGSDGSLGGLMALCTMKDFNRVLGAQKEILVHVLTTRYARNTSKGIMVLPVTRVSLFRKHPVSFTIPILTGSCFPRVFPRGELNEQLLFIRNSGNCSNRNRLDGRWRRFSSVSDRRTF